MFHGFITLLVRHVLNEREPMSIPEIRAATGLTTSQVSGVLGDWLRHGKVHRLKAAWNGGRLLYYWAVNPDSFRVKETLEALEATPELGPMILQDSAGKGEREPEPYPFHGRGDELRALWQEQQELLLLSFYKSYKQTRYEENGYRRHAYFPIDHLSDPMGH